MTNESHNDAAPDRTNRRRAWIVALCVLALVIAGWATAHGPGVGGDPIPEDMGGRWEETLTALNAPNTCHEDGLKCAEWCTLYHGGTAQGTGVLCCIDPNAVGTSTNFDDCQGLR